MNHWQEQAIQIIEQQQKGIENTAPWMVGEQLKDICRMEPDNAELIAQDLAVPEMSLTEAEKKIKAYADSHKKGSFSCVTPSVAEDILRKFYGLKMQKDQSEQKPVIQLPNPKPQGGLSFNLADFL